MDENAIQTNGGATAPGPDTPAPQALVRRPLMGLPVYFRKGTQEPKPAIVTKVHDEKRVDLSVLTGLARENAKQKMWPLMGYALRETLHALDAAI